jgi:hypothetical protein
VIPDLEIKKLTAELRESDEARWRRLRALLGEKGIDTARAAMAYLAEEDPCCEFGVVVTAEKKAFQFVFDCLRRDVIKGVFSEWEDVTDQLARKPWREEALLAMKLLERTGGEEQA